VGAGVGALAGVAVAVGVDSPAGSVASQSGACSAPVRRELPPARPFPQSPSARTCTK
jgi:hypothetical protein